MAQDTLYFVRVFTLLPSIQSPFQRASINSSPNRFKTRHNEGSKKPFDLSEVAGLSSYMSSLIGL